MIELGPVEAAIYVTMIGSVPLATPTEKPAMTKRQMESLERAWIAAEEGRTGAVEHCVRKIERRMWPKGFDPHHELRCREAKAEPETTRKAVRQKEHWRGVGERRRAAQLNEPHRSPALASETQRDLKALGRAEADAAKARDEANAARERKDHKAHRAAVGREREAFAAVRTLRKAIQADRTKQLDARWAAHALSETEALAKGRSENLADEKTEVSDWLRDPETGDRITEDGLPVLGTERAKARRANDHDPLKSLLKAGKLTAEQYDTGVDVHACYEARSEGLGSQMGAIGRVGSPSFDNSASIFGGVQRGKKLQKLGSIERAIAQRAKDDEGRWDPNALAMLRAVCGEGKSLTSQGKGRTFDRNAKALGRALDIADDVLRGRN